MCLCQVQYDNIKQKNSQTLPPHNPPFGLNPILLDLDLVRMGVFFRISFVGLLPLGCFLGFTGDTGGVATSPKS